MGEALSIAVVRRCVAAAFARRGWDVEGELRETILLSGGSYCGRRFETRQGYAVWLVDDEALAIFDAHGELVEEALLRAEAPQYRQAA